MTELSNFLENELFDDVLRAATYTGPATVYLAVFTAAPGEAGGGTEVSGFAYARTAVTFGAPTDGSGSNSGLVSFPQATGGAWGLITHAALMDAATVGNFLMYSPLTASVTVNDGDTLTFAIANVIAQFQ